MPTFDSASARMTDIGTPHNKKRKWPVRILKWLVLLLLLTGVLGLVVIRSSWAQSHITKWAANSLSKDLNTTMSVGRVDIDLFKTVVLEDIYIEDQMGDTLAFIGELEGDISSFSIEEREIGLSRLRLAETYFHMYTPEGGEDKNIQFLIDHFATNDSTKEKKSWDLSLDRLLLEDVDFVMDDFNRIHDTDRVDFKHLHLHDIYADLQDISLEEGIGFKIVQLSAVEHSGFHIDSLTGQADFYPDRMDFTGLDVKTDHSTLDLDYSLQYEDMKDFKDFENKVWMKATIRDGLLGLTDLAFFAPAYKGMSREVDISGVIRGEVADLHGTGLDIRFGEWSQFVGEVSLDGLPDLSTTFIDLRVDRIVSSMTDLRHLPVPDVGDRLADIPTQLKDIGNFVFNGSFVGFPDDFVVTGDIDTELGSMTADIAMIQRGEDSGSAVKGKVSTPGIAIGQILGQKELGGISADLEVDVEGTDFTHLGGQVSGLVHHIEYQGFTYRHITLDGQLESGLYNGDLSINQPEISFDFSGVVDLRNQRPEFDFNARLFEADLHALGFSQERDSTSLTGQFKVAFSGDDADNFEGTIDVEGLSYCEGGNEFFFKDFFIGSRSVNADRFISLRSTPIDLDMSGQFKFRDLVSDVEDLMNDVIPSIGDSSVIADTDALTDVYIAAVLKETEQITEIFLPDWTIGDSTLVDGRLDMNSRRLDVKIDSDSVTFRDKVFEQILVDASKSSDVAYVAIENAHLQWSDSLAFRENYFTLYAKDDKVESDLTWTMDGYNTSGFFAVTGDVYSKDSIALILRPSQLVVSDDYWTTSAPANIIYDHGDLYIDSLAVTNGQERLFASGHIADDEDSEFIFDVEDFKLSHLNRFINDPLFELSGTTNLSGTARDILDTFSIETEMTIDSLEFGGEQMGDLSLKSAWNTGESTLGIFGELAKEGQNNLTIDGEYFPANETDRLDATLTFDDFDLDVLNRLKTSAFSGIGGTADGQLTLGGDFLKPDISGELDFTEASITIAYTNTSYTFSNKVKVEKDWIGFDYIPFRDKYGNQGNANGTVIHENYRNWNYDIFADFTDALVLNTTAVDNELYYGTVFATGSVSLSGFDDLLQVEVLGRTEAGTTLELPLGASSEVALENFVTFIDVNDSTLTDRDVRLDGVDLHLEAELTPDAEIRLVFDETVGDVIEGSGRGNLAIDVTRKGDFNMYGEYVIEKGDYLFTLQNVLNKRFGIERGSTIRFFGDPYDAELDITAVYDVRTSLYDIMYENPEAYRRRVPVEVEMQLTNTLLTPDIEFDIEFPGMEADLRTVVESRVNTAQELNKQVFALLVLNKFLAPDNSTSGGASSAGNPVGNTGAEFLSSQLSNWLSQGFEDVDIGVNYRPGDNVTSDELAVALTTQLFNDRLILQGNVGVQNNRNTAVGSDGTASSVIGDFVLEYMLTQDGKLRLKVFNKTNDYDLLDIYQSRNTQGVGFIFQRDFDGMFDDERKQDEERFNNSEVDKGQGIQ